MRRVAVGLVVGFLGTLGACNSNGGGPADGGPGWQRGQGGTRYHTQSREANAARDLDLLFVIDNSSGMREEQLSLASSFPRLVDALQKGPGGLPNLHVGFITTDVGGGAVSPGGSCARPGGDRGRLIVRPTCGVASGPPFVVALDGGRERNFTGELADVLGCLSLQGDTGCGYEQPLESLRLALADREVVNTGFLRPAAHLAIVIVSDEDDCSAPELTTLFGERRDGEGASFRCAREGHLCNGMKPPAADFTAPLPSCTSNESGQLTRVRDFVDFVRRLKPEHQLAVAAIVGLPAQPPGQYRVSQSRNNGWDLDDVCTSTALGSATPAIRTKLFVDAFGPRGMLHSVCNADGLAGPVESIATNLRRFLDAGCVAVRLVDTNPSLPGVQPDCQVVDRIPGPTGMMTDVPLPACSDGGPRPCWRLAAQAACSASGHEVTVERNVRPPMGAQEVISCLTCSSLEDPRCPR